MTAAPKPFSWDFAPGIVKADSSLAADRRYVDAQWVRFVRNKPEKIGGFAKRSTFQFSGIPRSILEWADLLGRTLVAVGSSGALEVLSQDGTPINITPASRTVALANPFSTLAHSLRVLVTDLGHTAKAGDSIVISGGLAIAGRLIRGRFTVIAVTPNKGGFYIDLGGALFPKAVTGGGKGPAAVHIAYELSPGPVDPVNLSGFGFGGFGTGVFGIAGNSTTAYAVEQPRIWTLANFGTILLASPLGGGLYQWDANVQTSAAALIANAPTMNAFFVTDERYIIALGTNGDPMQVAWPNQNTLDQWAVVEGGTANIRRLQAGTKIVAGHRLMQGSYLVWTDAAVYIFRYTTSSYVYDSRTAGEKAGLIGPNAAIVAAGRAYWMSGHGFHIYSGGVNEVPNQIDIRDYVFARLDPVHAYKTICAYNPKFSEVWWFYVPLGATEPTEYVMVETTTHAWSTGTLARSASGPQPDGRATMLLAGQDGYLYDHETGTDADGAPLPSRLRTSAIKVGDAVQSVDFWGFFPDFQRQTNDVNILLEGYDRRPDMAGSPLVDSQSMVIVPGATVEDMHVGARYIVLSLSTDKLGDDWRLGAPQIEYTASGARR